MTEIDLTNKPVIRPVTVSSNIDPDEDYFEKLISSTPKNQVLRVLHHQIVDLRKEKKALEKKIIKFNNETRAIEKLKEISNNQKYNSFMTAILTFFAGLFLTNRIPIDSISIDAKIGIGIALGSISILWGCIGIAIKDFIANFRHKKPSKYDS
jgi:hypothetical protein